MIKVYREHIDELGDYSGLRSPSVSKWVCVAVIGMACGVASWLLRNLIAWVFKMRFEHYKTIVDSYALAWSWSTGYSVLAVALSSSLVVYVEPMAASGGVMNLMQTCLYHITLTLTPTLIN